MSAARELRALRETQAQTLEMVRQLVAAVAQLAQVQATTAASQAGSRRPLSDKGSARRMRKLRASRKASPVTPPVTPPESTPRVKEAPSLKPSPVTPVVTLKPAQEPVRVHVGARKALEKQEKQRGEKQRSPSGASSADYWKLREAWERLVPGWRWKSKRDGPLAQDILRAAPSVDAAVAAAGELARRFARARPDDFDRLRGLSLRTLRDRLAELLPPDVLLSPPGQTEKPRAWTDAERDAWKADADAEAQRLKAEREQRRRDNPPKGGRLIVEPPKVAPAAIGELVKRLSRAAS
ncbi:MAG: hypothetical protein JST92_11290 [Deltaproteobacteria bacterium]|nr:hypothetical protein [Deltaproteobacteria bacterium]